MFVCVCVCVCEGLYMPIHISLSQQGSPCSSGPSCKTGGSMIGLNVYQCSRLNQPLHLSPSLIPLSPPLPLSLSPSLSLSLHLSPSLIPLSLPLPLSLSLS